MGLFYRILAFIYVRLLARGTRSFVKWRDLPSIDIGIKKTEESRNILIGAIRISEVSNLLEGIIGSSFSRTGDNVTVLVCSGSLGFCEQIGASEVLPRLKCQICQERQKSFVKSFELASISVDDVVSKADIQEIHKECFSRNFKENEDFHWGETDLRESITSGAMRHLLSTEVDLNTLRRSAVTAVTCAVATRRILVSHSIDAVIQSHGIYSTWGSVQAVLNDFSIPNVVWGRGYVGQGNILLGLNKPYHQQVLEEENSVWNNISIDDNHLEKTFNYFSKKHSDSTNVDYVNYYDGLLGDNRDEIRHLKDYLSHYDSSFGYYCNIPWDGQVFNKTIDFYNTEIVIRTLVDWFIENKRCCLVIRAHPAEATGIENISAETFQSILGRLYPVLPDNVKFLEPKCVVTSYDLSNVVNYNVVFGSTLALEFAFNRKPVIQLGKFNVNGKNIVYETPTIDAFNRIMRMAALNQLEMTEEMHDNAVKYGYYWINEKHVKDDILELERLKFSSYLINSKDLVLNTGLFRAFENALVSVITEKE